MTGWSAIGAWFGVGLMASALAGCMGGSQPEALIPATCEPRDADPTSLERVDELAGDYGLTLVATSGDEAGEKATGRLTLVARDSTAVPFYGWTDLPVAVVGAHANGSLAAREVEAPGVLVLAMSDSHGAGRVESLTLRLGSNANRVGQLLFDGAYTALYVRWIDEGGFGGDWSSGVTTAEAQGRFCALGL